MSQLSGLLIASFALDFTGLTELIKIIGDLQTQTVRRDYLGAKKR